MRIRKERQESNVRITKLEVHISQAISDTEGDYTHLEIILALQNQTAWWVNHARNLECPSIQKDEDDERST